MSRPLRIEYKDAIYHVMNRGLTRQSIFLTDEDYEKFLNVIAEAHSHWQIQVYAYCMMRNHYHLCLGTPEGNISRVMRHIDGVYTQRFNRAHGKDGPLCRGRYKAIIVDEEAYLGSVVRYIHLNPLKAQVVKEPQEYLWSSHRVYLNPDKGPQWLKVDKLLESFEGSKGFQAYVMEGNDEEIERFYGGKKQGVILGREEFIEKVKESGQEPHQENTRDEARYLGPTVEKLIEAVRTYYHIEKSKIEQGCRGQENEARDVAIFLAYETCDMKHREIARLFRLSHSGTVGWYCLKVRKEMEKDDGLKKRVKAVQVLIKELILQHKT